MTIVPPAPGEPRRPDGPKDPGDAWVIAPDGTKYWGRFGASGLLALDPQRGVLLQHRVGWSHFGGTWGLPGGALHQDEGPVEGAIREAHEEAGVPDASVRARFTSVLDLGYWAYTTVIADVLQPFEPVMGDAESLALEWVPVDDVALRDLHPGFGDSWPRLRALLSRRPVIVVDAANVVGSTPDGWWKDRAGATARLRDSLATVTVPDADDPAVTWHPEIVLVVEGQAREVPDAPSPCDGEPDAAQVEAVTSTVQIVRAAGEGDDTIVAEAARLCGEGYDVTVVTSDKELRERAAAVGAHVEGVRWLHGHLG